MAKRELIERAIDSAKTRIYRLAENEKYGVGEAHQKKIDRQKEVMEVTIEALERMLPKKPYEGRFGVFRCSCCDEKVGQKVTKVLKEDCMNFCAYCGSKVDWSE